VSNGTLTASTCLGIKRQAIAFDCSVTSLVVAKALLEWLKWMRKIEPFERKNDQEVKKKSNRFKKKLTRKSQAEGDPSRITA